MRIPSLLLCLVGSSRLVHHAAASIPWAGNLSQETSPVSDADASALAHARDKTRELSSATNLHDWMEEAHEGHVDDEHAASASSAHATNLFSAEGGHDSHAEGGHDSHAEGGHDSHAEGGHEGEHAHPHYAILWPVTTLVFGVVIYYGLSRYLHFIPYTAAMFLLGMVYGLVEAYMTKDLGGNLNTSVEMWSHIDAHTLLMVFLPGLLFKDAFALNVHLFAQAFWQCWIMAFPAVLLGTGIVGWCAHEVLPYNWPWTFCFAFGAILSATDPVAVAALLNECGAPPRLKTHIAGEALLNDGSAMVFFVLFEEMYLWDKTGGAVGVQHTAGSGIALFFKMSLGAVGIGLGFGIALSIVLWALKRRFSFEENVVQVMATLAFAYMTYYVAEVPGTSGVIATVACGLFAKAFGDSMINDHDLMHKFWDLLEHILNTVLFALGGLVWGEVISNQDLNRPTQILGSDWGHLFQIYVLAMLIRSFNVMLFFPVVSRIGLSTSWQESLFCAWGGLRGAVGIALAIALDNADGGSAFTTELFFMVGGIAFLTLFVNGVTAGPLLKKLGLANISESRKSITHRYHRTKNMTTLTNFLHFLGQEEFQSVDFAIVRKHIPYLRDISDDDVIAAIRMNKARQPLYQYKVPELSGLVPFVSEKLAGELDKMASVGMAERLKSMANARQNSTHIDDDSEGDEEDISYLIELRKTFVDLLFVAFESQLESGNIDARNKRVVFALREALESEQVNVSNGAPIRDYESLMARFAKVEKVENATKLNATLNATKLRRNRGDEEPPPPPQSQRPTASQGKSMRRLNSTIQARANTRQLTLAGAVISNHRRAQKAFKAEFAMGKILLGAEQTVLNESDAQIEAARDQIESMDPDGVQNVFTHILCTILLNNEIAFIGSYVDRGLLRETEAEHEIEHIAELIHNVDSCNHTQCRGVAKSDALEGEVGLLKKQLQESKQASTREMAELRSMLQERDESIRNLQARSHDQMTDLEVELDSSSTKMNSEEEKSWSQGEEVEGGKGVERSGGSVSFV